MRVEGIEILKVRNALGETQAQFAARFGMNRRTIIRWEQEGTYFYSGGWSRETNESIWYKAEKSASLRGAK